MPVIWSINTGNTVGESYKFASNTENIMYESDKNENI
jgi:hypothetical protein